MVLPSPIASKEPEGSRGKPSIPCIYIFAPTVRHFPECDARINQFSNLSCKYKAITPQIKSTPMQLPPILTVLCRTRSCLSPALPLLQDGFWSRGHGRVGSMRRVPSLIEPAPLIFKHPNRSTRPRAAATAHRSHENHPHPP